MTKIIQVSLSLSSDKMANVRISHVESKQTSDFVCPLDCLGSVVVSNLK